MHKHHKNRLKNLIREHAVLHGDFTLASGKKSKVYYDLRRVTLLPSAANIIVRMILEMEPEAQAVGGLTLGADPIVGAVVGLAGFAYSCPRSEFYVHKTPVGFLVRKEAKDHGAGRLIEGPDIAGLECVIVEDVTTTGQSALVAVRAAEKAKASVLRVVTVLDRQQGAAEMFDRMEIPFTPLVRLDELGG